MLTSIEKVLFLQDIDIFENTATEDLAFIAAITEEIEAKANTVLYKEEEKADSMYLVIEGSVKLHQKEREVMTAKPKDFFGTWALFDDEPRVVSATTLEECRLLKIDREEFYDLLADHTKITQGVLKTLSKRLRSLLNKVRVDVEST
ncbi:cyclic nucleotide-binding domain-containing protein [candidate division KSB1 bacterium]|nr:cyclic nucleotide-binding domain-containing protein [candidate division KSB1 bacterium]